MKEFKLLRTIGILSCLFGILFILLGDIKTPENFRILSDFIQNLFIINLILLIFLPDDKTIKIALIIGIMTMIIDFILETVAVYLNWWYPLGGTQFPPLIVVPLEMVVSFVIIGTTMGILLTFPEKIRDMDFKLLNWVKPLFENEKFDWFWRFLLIFLNAFVGTNGDYTAGPTIWAPGPYWQPIFTFFVWLGGGMLILLMFYFLEKQIQAKK